MKVTKKLNKKLIELINKLPISRDGKLNFFNKLIETLEEKQGRSLPELNLYFVLMEWLAKNTPERFLKSFDIDYINKNMWNLICKAKFHVFSIDFDSMSESEFNEYFQNVQQWIKDFVLEITDKEFDLMEEINDIA